MCGAILLVIYNSIGEGKGIPLLLLPFIEETIKFGVAVGIMKCIIHIWKSHPPNRCHFLYVALFTGLGFALMENFLPPYVDMIATRLLVINPLHAAWTSIIFMWLYFYRWDEGRNNIELNRNVVPIIISVGFIHLLYNGFSTGVEQFSYLPKVPLIATLLWLGSILYAIYIGLLFKTKRWEDYLTRMSKQWKDFLFKTLKIKPPSS